MSLGQQTRDVLSVVRDQLARLRAAIQNADDIEAMDALNTLDDAIDDLKLTLGITIDSAPPPETA
jgi:hypothetical protein